MALDKQKILNELGNVVNQLQSADCGCMGKLFSNSHQANPNAMASPPHDGYMQGCCHAHGCGQGCHGFSAPGAGEPFPTKRPCMGFCNPPKLYADTYNYLNHNLMQPVVKEVYDDLKSITPANTMINNPMAAQMGLSQGNNLSPAGAGAVGGNMVPNQVPGGAMENQNAMSNNHHGPNVRFGNTNMNNSMQMGNPNSPQQIGEQQMGQQQMGQQQMGQQQMGQQQMGQQQMVQPMASMRGMGPNIVNMMMGDAAARASSQPNHGSQQADVNNHPQQSPDGQGQYNVGMTGNYLGQYNTGNMEMKNMVQENPGASIQNPTTPYMLNSTTPYMSQPNMYEGTNRNMQGNTNGNVSQMNPGTGQRRSMSASPPQPMNAGNPYGVHSAGITKFNEMFPGVMQGGDLGFDPMAIAIQMNPANQQRAAMDTMQKMMMSNGEGLGRVNASLLQPVINATNAAAANIAPNNQSPVNQTPGQQNMVPTSMQQQMPGANAAAVPVQNNQVPQQQVYTALTGAPTMQQVTQKQIPPQQQVPLQQQNQGHYQQPQQQMIDPNTGAIVTGSLPTVYEGSGDPNARQEGSPPTQSSPTTQQMIKDPIFPADTSRNMPPAHMNMKPQKYYHYNTLGQPVEMLPAEFYRSPEPNLPQTLSPQPITGKTSSDPARYSNVRATISKTSLMGNRPIGRTPSRSQLQQIYNQYKGSQSYTQQNIRPPDNGTSYSDGHLNIPQSNVSRQAPIEKVGGDTAANNPMNNAIANTAEQKPGQVGDVSATNKPLSDAEKSPPNLSKVRNGLQDMTYTSYATSAAWSFHGATPAPYSTAYRFRNKV